MKIFKNELLNQKYLEEGYVIVKLFNSKDISEIKKFAKKMYADTVSNLHGFSTLPNPHISDEKCVAIHDFFKQLIARKKDEGLSQYLTEDFQFFNSVFLRKKTKSTNFYWHIDPSFYNQKKHERPVAIWGSIDKITTHNGCLQVVPKSHKLGYDYHPFSFLPLGDIKKEQLSEVYAELIKKHAIDITLQKGEVIIHDHALIHASRPNNSLFRKRLAFKFTYLPKEVKDFQMTYFDNKNDELNIHRFNKDDIYYYTSKTVGNYIENFKEMNDQLITKISIGKLKKPFQTLSEMEEIMTTPIDSSKAKFEIC